MTAQLLLEYLNFLMKLVKLAHLISSAYDLHYLTHDKFDTFLCILILYLVVVFWIG